MGILNLAAGSTTTISQSESDTVNFIGVGTLNVTGTASSPINVTFDQVSASLAGTLNITYAHVTFAGIASAAVNLTYNIGDGGTLDIPNVVDLSLGSNVNFTGATGHIILGNINVALGVTVTGFGPGKSIDFSAIPNARIAYSDNGGNNTGGVITVYNASNFPVTTISLGTGELAVGNFRIRSDGAAGTMLDFNTLVTGITTTPSNATLGPNATVNFVVTTGNPVSITGSPKLTLNDGGSAIYNAAASTSTSLVFTYTVASGQNTADLAVIGTALNGATMGTVGGGGFDLSGAIANPAGTLAIDTIAPTITSITTSQGSGYLSSGQIVNFNVALSEPIILVGGVPSLMLNDGGTATYDAANSTATNLVFRHAVQSGQNSADLAILGANLNGSTIADLAGNVVSLASFVVNPLGTLVVDTIAPTLTSVTTSPGSGALTTGQSVIFNVVPSEAVLVAGGTPILLLNDGGMAVYDAVNSTATNLVFRHTVQPGQTAADLSVIGSNLNGATITDLAGNGFNFASVIGNPAGILSVGGTGGGSTPVSTPVTTPSTTPSSTPATMPVYRFFESANGTHFYTSNPTERDLLLQSRPDLIFEGTGLRAINPASGDPMAIEVFRFFDAVKGTQFLTASKDERDAVIANRSDLKYEPAGSFFEHTQPQPNDTPVYRFFSASDGTHFFTDNAVERANIIQTRPDLVAEGVGFYEPA